MPEFGSRCLAPHCHTCSCCDTCRHFGSPTGDSISQCEITGLALLRGMRWLLGLLLIASTAAAEPPRRRVHIDHLDPAKVGQFEQARKDWVAWIAAHHVADPWGGTFLQVGGSTFLTLQPFTTWAELDAPPPSTLDPKARKLYHERSDDALVPPHHNEIWLRQPALDYAAIAPAGAGVITYEQVKLDDTYETAWAEIQKELVAAKYPVSRVAFFDQYGSGKHVSLWLAPTKAAFAAAPTIDQVLEKRLGKAKAAALLARWRGAVISHEDADVVVRADLSN